MVCHLKAEPDRVEVDGLWAVGMVEALSEGIHTDLLPLLQRLGYILPEHAYVMPLCSGKRSFTYRYFTVFDIDKLYPDWQC